LVYFFSFLFFSSIGFCRHRDSLIRLINLSNSRPTSYLRKKTANRGLTCKNSGKGLVEVTEGSLLDFGVLVAYPFTEVPGTRIEVKVPARQQSCGPVVSRTPACSFPDGRVKSIAT